MDEEIKINQRDHAGPSYAENEEMCGVLAFRLRRPSEHMAAPYWNMDQKRWLQLLRDDIARGSQAYISDEESTWDKVRLYLNSRVIAYNNVTKSSMIFCLDMTCKYLETVRVTMSGRRFGMIAGGTTAFVPWKAHLVQARQLLHVLWLTKSSWTCCGPSWRRRWPVAWGNGFHKLVLHDDQTECALCLAPYALVVVDEFSQLEGRHLAHLLKLHKAADRVPAIALLGDKWQMAGFGSTRPWETAHWRTEARNDPARTLSMQGYGVSQGPEQSPNIEADPHWTTWSCFDVRALPWPQGMERSLSK